MRQSAVHTKHGKAVGQAAVYFAYERVKYFFGLRRQCSISTKFPQHYINLGAEGAELVDCDS